MKISSFAFFLTVLFGYSHLSFGKQYKKLKKNKLQTREQGVFKGVNLDQLSFHERQYVRKKSVEFFISIEQSEKIEVSKHVFIKKLKHFIFEYAYASDENCFFAGWPSQRIGGVCKSPKTHGRKSSYAPNTTYQECGGNKFQCYPLLFGEKKCVDMGSDGFRDLTQKCADSTTAAERGRLAGASNVKNLNAMAREITNYCKQMQQQHKSSHPHNLTCQALERQMSDLLANKQEEQQAKPVQEIAENISENKALSVLKNCKNKYNEDNVGFWASLTKSNRALIDQVITNSTVSCHDEKPIDVKPDELDHLFKEVENLGDHAKESELLESISTASLEQGLEARLTHMAHFESSDFLQKPAKLEKIRKELKKKFLAKKRPSRGGRRFKEVDSREEKAFNRAFEKAFNKTKAKKLKMKSSQEIGESFKDFAKKLNKACAEIKVEVSKKLGRRPTGRGAMASRNGKQSSFRLWKDKYERYLNETGKIKLFGSLQEFSHNNSNISTLLYAEKFKEIFPLDEKLADKCARGDIDQAVNSDAINLESIALAKKQIKDSINVDLGNSKKSRKALLSGSKKSVIDQIDENLKYRPYLLGTFLAKITDTKDKEFYAKLICQRSLEIYNEDELWNLGSLTGGIVVGTIAGFTTGALGFGLGASLVTGAAVSVAEATTISLGEFKTAGKIVNGATIGTITDNITHEQALSREKIAKQRKLNAYFALSGIAVAPVSHGIAVAARTIKATRVSLPKASRRAPVSSFKRLPAQTKMKPISSSLPKVYKDELVDPENLKKIERITNYMQKKGHLKAGEALSEEQKRAIIQAHKIGLDEGKGYTKICPQKEKGCQPEHTFTKQDIADKTRALRGKNGEPLFTRDVREFSLRSGITGRLNHPKFSSNAGQRARSITDEIRDLSRQITKNDGVIKKIKLSARSSFETIDTSLNERDSQYIRNLLNSFKEEEAITYLKRAEIAQSLDKNGKFQLEQFLKQQEQIVILKKDNRVHSSLRKKLLNEQEEFFKNNHPTLKQAAPVGKVMNSFGGSSFDNPEIYLESAQSKVAMIEREINELKISQKVQSYGRVRVVDTRPSKKEFTYANEGLSKDEQVALLKVDLIDAQQAQRALREEIPRYKEARLNAFKKEQEAQRVKELEKQQKLAAEKQAHAKQQEEWQKRAREQEEQRQNQIAQVKQREASRAQKKKELTKKLLEELREKIVKESSELENLQKQVDAGQNAYSNAVLGQPIKYLDFDDSIQVYTPPSGSIYDWPKEDQEFVRSFLPSEETRNQMSQMKTNVTNWKFMADSADRGYPGEYFQNHIKKEMEKLGD